MALQRLAQRLGGATQLHQLPSCMAAAAGQCWPASMPHLRTPEQQLQHAGPCSTSSRAHASAASSRQLHASSGQPEEDRAARPHRFMSPQPVAGSAHVPLPPFHRPPIYFPDITLQVLKTLSDEEFKQLRETGWVREVAFKTTPNVSRPEIRAYLESVYGMKVERVTTINYLGKRHVVVKGKRMFKYRADDWKKVYVTFAPSGVQLSAPPGPQAPTEMLREVRAAAKPR